MKRIYFAEGDPEAKEAKPRLSVFVEMAGGQAGATFDKKQTGAFVKRDELLRGFERALPDGTKLRVQAFPIERPPTQAPLPAPDALPRTFEPYRVRAWIDGREQIEIVGQASREDARAALILLLLVGLGDLALGLRLYPISGATRFLLSGPVFLLGALGLWRKWSWSVSLALIVAVADTIIFFLRSVQHPGTSIFFFTMVARLALISALWRLRKSGG